MARKRMVSPELFTSESVAALPISTRYTWVGLLCYLDDFGKGKDNAALVKAAVWPLDEGYTTRKVAKDLDLLVDNGMLCRYECCGTAQVHSPSWALWQRISHATDTKLCPCPVHEREASRIHRMDSGVAPDSLRNGSGAALHNVVEVSSDKSSSRGRALSAVENGCSFHRSPLPCRGCAADAKASA